MSRSILNPCQFSKTQPPEKFSPAIIIFTSLIAIFILAMSAYSAWDYHRISQIYLAPAMRSEAYRNNTLEKIKGTQLFQNQVRFAELTTTTLTLDNAKHLNTLAHEMLHFSPEARVAEKLIESAELLGNEDEVKFFAQHLQVAFPDEFARWSRDRQGLDKPKPDSGRP